MSPSGLPVATAVPGAPWEGRLVTAVEEAAPGLSVVRRCVDIADLLAVSATGQVRAALVSDNLRHLDRDAIDRLGADRVGVVGVIAPGDDVAERRLRDLGIAAVVSATDDAADIVAAVRQVVGGVDLARGTGPGPTSGQGRLVAVWGPAGAPGRTTVAVAVASELAQQDVPTLLADADSYGGCVAQVLGLLDESPGLAAAARAANAGQLDLQGLAVHARQVLPQLRVLTGLVRADRWPELRPGALAEVWSLARRLAEVTVIDCGFCLEQDEEISFDTSAPRRNGATLITLDQADLVLAVGSADPVGMQRLIRGLATLAEVAPGRAPWVVVNRVRRTAVGANPEDQIAAALSRYAGISEFTFVPYDRPTLDRAVLEGLTLAEVAPDSPVRKAFVALAGRVAALVSPAERRSCSRGPRRRRHPRSAS